MGASTAVHQVPVRSVAAVRWRPLLVVALAVTLAVVTSSGQPAEAAGPAVTLSVTAPARATAGTAFSVTVTARDAAGAVATSYRGRVRFTSTDPRSPVLPAAYTFTVADAGRRTFTGVRLFSAGARTVAAFDTVRATVKGRSTAIAVGAAVATRLTVAAPATVTSGAAFPVSVTARDAWSNVATGYRGTVRFTGDDPGRETLPAPYVFTAADRGTHRFPGIVLVSAGSRTVTATDTATTRLTGRSPAVAVAPRYALYRWVLTGSTNPAEDLAVPALQGPETRWVAVDATGHALAIRSDRTLWAWGRDSDGELGDGAPSMAEVTVPQRVGTRADWATVAAGEWHSLAVKSNGTLWAWGDNAEGQLGDGTTTDRSTPVPVGTGETWRTVAASSVYSAGITTGGTLWIWGGEHPPQRPRDDDRVGSLVPVRIGDDSDWSSVSVGADHVLALKVDGSLWAWGSDGAGQLGDGPATGSLYVTPFSPGVPARVGTSTWSSVEASSFRSMGVRTDGTLWVWGSTPPRDEGGARVQHETVPVQIGVGSTWRSARDGFDGTLGLRSDGTMWMWSPYGRPLTRIGTSGGWVSVSGGLVVGLRSTVGPL